MTGGSQFLYFLFHFDSLQIRSLFFIDDDFHVPTPFSIFVIDSRIKILIAIQILFLKLNIFQ